MQVFWQSFNLPKRIVVVLSMVDGGAMVGLFVLLFCCECSINQFAGQKTLTDALGASFIT